MIIFENEGLISKRSITTFGVSSKENESAIGYFGTGLKYAIAILLRENIDITIYIGKEKLVFTKETETVRVDDFDIVCMNGEKLGFTTELGKNWALWQAFRELYCNCTDEYGKIRKGKRVASSASKTVVAVKGKEFDAIYDNLDEYFLSSEPIYKDNSVEIHSGGNNAIFYKGVRIHSTNKPTLYTYNFISSVSLTEDRTVSSLYSLNCQLGRMVLACDDGDIIRNMCTAPDTCYESEIDFNWSTDPSDAFLSTIGALHKEFSRSVNRSALAKFLAIHKSKAEPEKKEVSDIQKMQLVKAIKFCKLIGHKVDDYPIIVTDFMGDGVLGMARDGNIYVSSRVFMTGTKYLAATILEEYFHLQFKLHDETYEMQNFLFDVIMTVGEQFALKEPL